MIRDLDGREMRAADTADTDTDDLFTWRPKQAPVLSLAEKYQAIDDAWKAREAAK